MGCLFIDFFRLMKYLGRLRSARINLNNPLTARSTLAIDSEFCVSFQQWTDKDGWIWRVSPLSAAVPIFRERRGTSISCMFRHCLKQYTIRRHSWRNGGCATVCLGNIRYVTMAILRPAQAQVHSLTYCGRVRLMDFPYKIPFIVNLRNIMYYREM